MSAVELFDQQNGGVKNRVQVDGWWYYPTGAKRQLTTGFRDCDPEMFPPPTDPIALATNQLVYWNDRTKRAAEAFDGRKIEMSAATRQYTTHHQMEAFIDELDGLQEFVNHCRAERDKSRAALQKARGPKTRRTWNMDGTFTEHVVDEAAEAEQRQQERDAYALNRIRLQKIEI